MIQFKYKAKDKNGATVSGVVEGMSAQIAAHTLQDHGLLVISISEKRDFSLKTFHLSLGGVSNQDVATFTRLMSTMLKAGLPLVDALSNLSFQVKNPYFKDVVRSILHDVQSGGSLSLAMSRYPNVFNNLYVSLVRSGEASGKAEESMEKLADMLESDQEFRGKVKGAMIYPMIVVLAMGAVGIFMITTIIPKIAQVYTDFNAQLPLPTQILINISNILRNYTVFVVIFFVVVFFAVKVFRKNPTSDMLINNALLKMPIFGSLQVDVKLTIMTRTLGTLINAGVSILDSLRIVAAAMSNDYFRQGLLQAAQEVEKGLPFSGSLRRNPNFPVIMAQLTSIGEETGTMGESLNRLAKFYQESAERKVKALTSTLEPVMIIVMGIMVGGLAIAVLLPMFNLVNVIK